MAHFYRALLRSGLLLTLLLVWPVADAAAQADAAKDPGDVDPQIERIEELSAELESQRRELSALERQAEQATGGDLIALQSQGAEMRFSGSDTLRDLARAVLESELPKAEVAPHREHVETLLPQFAAALAANLDLAERSIAELKAEREEAAAEAQAELDQRIQRADTSIAHLLDIGIEQVGLLKEFGLPTGALPPLLKESVATRALLASSHMNLASIQLADATERSSAAPDDAALQAELAALTGRLAYRTTALSTAVAQLEALEIDATQYKRQLLEATGQISTDIFDSGVAGQFLKRWSDGVGESIAQDGPSAIFRTVLFILVLAFFWALSRFVRKVTERAVEAPHLRFSQLLKRMLISLASGTVMMLGLLVGLSQLGVEVGPLVAGLGIAGFVVGFALQDTLANFAAGVMILAYRPYDVGELIECAGGVFGKVSHMNLVSTTILTVDNQTRIVPNGKIWGDVITNLSAQKYRRVDLLVGISYEDDIPHAEKVIWSILEEHPKVLADPEPVVKVHELGDSSVNLVVRPWATPDDYWDVYWDVTREVKLRFDREGVSIPFPQRDVHFYPTTNDAEASSVEPR